jgi:hypothetical protein
MTKISTSVAIAALLATVPALAQDSWKDKQRDQLLYQEQLKMQDQAGDQGAIGATKPNSGPGVQGAPDTRTGPATKAPGDSAEMGSSSSANEGVSSGTSGKVSGDATTQPSQDSSGVQGFPDTRTGPSTHEPSASSSSGPSTGEGSQ